MIYLIYLIAQKCDYLTSRFQPKVGVKTVQKNFFEKRNVVGFRHVVSIFFLNSFTIIYHVYLFEIHMKIYIKLFTKLFFRILYFKAENKLFRSSFSALFLEEKETIQ